jgi:hypothetical protein
MGTFLNDGLVSLQVGNRRRIFVGLRGCGNVTGVKLWVIVLWLVAFNDG